MIEHGSWFIVKWVSNIPISRHDKLTKVTRNPPTQGHHNRLAGITLPWQKIWTEMYIIALVLKIHPVNHGGK